MKEEETRKEVGIINIHFNIINMKFLITSLEIFILIRKILFYVLNNVAKMF